MVLNRVKSNTTQAGKMTWAHSNFCALWKTTVCALFTASVKPCSWQHIHEGKLMTNCKKIGRTLGMKTQEKIFFIRWFHIKNDNNFTADEENFRGKFRLWNVLQKIRKIPFTVENLKKNLKPSR